MKKIYYIYFVMVWWGLSAATVANVAQVYDAAKTVDSAQIDLKAKKLKCPQMNLLNMVFEERPYAVVRTKITCAKAARALQALNDLQKNAAPGVKKYFKTDTEERAFITGHLKLLVDPVRQFFDLVRDYKTIVNPVIAESLGISSHEYNKSWLLKFFESKDEATIFFDQEIKSLDDLKRVSLEFIKVFGDVNESLSDRARTLCDDIIRKMQETQKQVQTVDQKKA